MKCSICQKPAMHVETRPSGKIGTSIDVADIHSPLAWAGYFDFPGYQHKAHVEIVPCEPLQSEF